MILIFNWRCWLNPAMGGAEVFTYENAKRWVKAGHEVNLFTSKATCLENLLKCLSMKLTVL
jgi:hypothetical protein